MDKRQIGGFIGTVILLAWVSVTRADTVPEEAQRYMARGMAAVEMAEAPKDYERAVREFEQAANLAPNWSDVYFNLGSVQTKAGNYAEAMRYYKRYLELAPNAPDATKVREDIYKLEYRAEEEKRVKEIKRDGRFIAYSNGAVLDTRTNLVWAAKDNGSDINWQEAKSYCENYRGGDYTDWRMPTQDELEGLFVAGKTQRNEVMPKYPLRLTDLIDLTTGIVWASETHGSEADVANFTPESSGPGYSRYREPVGVYRYQRALPVRSNSPLLGSASVPSFPTGGYKGVRTYENGDKYEGEFTNRNFNGKGTYTYANGDKFVGEFIDGKFTSKGTFTCRNGRQFTGDLENKVPLTFTIRCN